MRWNLATASALGAFVAAVMAGACGGSTAPPPPSGDPASYLVTLAQLPSPDFTVYLPSAPVGAGWLDQGSSSALEKDGFARAAEIEYYRQVALDTSNGPITLTATAARFTTAQGAAAAMAHLDTVLDDRSGAAPLPTGSLGDGGHAIAVQGALDGVPVVELVVIWREDNLLNSLVAEGRFGGLLLDQVLPVATSQSQNELRKR